jgi:hypothetical protein
MTAWPSCWPISRRGCTWASAAAATTPAPGPAAGPRSAGRATGRRPSLHSPGGGSLPRGVGLELAAEAVAALEARTEGWAVGCNWPPCRCTAGPTLGVPGRLTGTHRYRCPRDRRWRYSVALAARRAWRRLLRRLPTTAVAPRRWRPPAGPVDAIVDLVGGAGLQASRSAVRMASWRRSPRRHLGRCSPRRSGPASRPQGRRTRAHPRIPPRPDPAILDHKPTSRTSR